jgi:dephospho-CoA kinase
MYVGLTGTIASGKSTAAKLFESYGAFSIDLDLVSRGLLEKGKPAYNQILATFGSSILCDNNDNIDRKKLRNIIFNNEDKRKTLESILHPLIREEEQRIVNSIKAKNRHPVIIVHAALLIETDSYKRFDALIVMYNDEANCLERLINRDKIPEELANSMIGAQLPINEKLKYANFILDNSRDIEYLSHEVKRVYNILCFFEKTKKILKKKMKLPTTYYKCTL